MVPVFVEGHECFILSVIVVVEGSVHEEVQFVTAVEIATSFTWAWLFRNNGTVSIQNVESNIQFVNFWLSTASSSFNIATSNNVIFSFNSIRVSIVSVWATEEGIVWGVDISNIAISGSNTARVFVREASVSGFAPEVLAALFSVVCVASSVSIVSSTFTFASFVSVLATVALINTSLFNFTPDVVSVDAVFAAVFLAGVGVFAVGLVIWAAFVVVDQTSVRVFTPDFSRFATV